MPSNVGELRCLFDIGLSDYSLVESAIKEMFLFMGARLDLLDDIMNNESERNRLLSEQKGINQQQQMLWELNSKPLVSETTLLYMKLVYEQARVHAMQSLMKLTDSYRLLTLRKTDEPIRALSRSRLYHNGQHGYSEAISSIVLYNAQRAVVRSYKNVQSCLQVESMQDAYHYWDLTNETHPSLFEKGLRTGKSGTISFELGINRDCANYHSARQPTYGHDQPHRNIDCYPLKETYYTSMGKVAIELLGGDDSLLPSGAANIRVRLMQVGSIISRRTATVSKSIFVRRKILNLPPADLGRQNIPTGKVQYESPCLPDIPSLTVESSIEKSQICPSPFSTYELNLGSGPDEALDPYLQSITTIRLHAMVKGLTDQGTMECCEPDQINTCHA